MEAKNSVDVKNLEFSYGDRKVPGDMRAVSSRNGLRPVGT